jgi:hypothetical protein
MCILVYTYMHTYIHTYIHTYMDTYMQTHTNIHTYIHIFMQRHSYIHICICIYIYIYIYITFPGVFGLRAVAGPGSRGSSFLLWGSGGVSRSFGGGGRAAMVALPCELGRTGDSVGDLVYRLDQLPFPIPVGRRCSTDFVVKVYKITGTGGGEPAVRFVRDLVMTEKPSKNGRVDISCHIPVGRWQAMGTVYLHRVVGWEVYRPTELRWTEFCRRAKGGKGDHCWQVHHESSVGSCHVLAGKLKVLPAAEHYELEANLRRSAPQKRPAAADARR